MYNWLEGVGFASLRACVKLLFGFSAGNGPGTYYGGCLDGFEDCLCGVFGVQAPFKLIWKNSLTSVKHLDEKEWKKHRLCCKKDYKKSLGSDVPELTLNLKTYNK